jgi:hypothetical protein
LKNFYSAIRQNPNSLYGKVKLRAWAVFGPLALCGVASLFIPDHPAVGMLAGAGIGLILSALAPWWVQHPERAVPKPGYLFPRVALKANVERRLLLGSLLCLGVGFFTDFNEEVTMAAQITGAALGAALASAHFPLWRVWPR